MAELEGPLTRNYKKGDIVCVKGEEENDLYLIHSGKLLVFLSKGTQITPLAYLNAGEYFGELSFFDGEKRSAHVACIEPSTLIQIPILELERQCPSWLVTVATSITDRIRRLDQLIGDKGIRKKKVETISPLSIDEQRLFYQALQNHQAN